MSSLINMITGKGNNHNADSNSSASSSSSSSMSSGSMSSSRSAAAANTTTGYNPNTHTQGYSNSGYGTSGAGTGTATGVAGVARQDQYGNQYGSNASTDTTTTTSTTTGSNVNNDGYLTRSEEQLRVGKEAYESGRAHLGKHVTTENVSTTVPISKERVVVEREPISSADIESGNLRSDIGEQSYEMRLKEERAIAEKEVVPIEKVRMRKEVETTQQEVGAELRKEHLDYNDGTGYNTNTGTYNKSHTTGTVDRERAVDGSMPTTSNTGYGATNTGYGTTTSTTGKTNTSY